MKKQGIIIALAAIALACSTNKSTVATPPTPPAPEAPVVPTNPEERIAIGKVLYDNQCGKCHRLYEPKENTKEDWTPILKRMQLKARLSDTNMAMVNEYVFSNL